MDLQWADHEEELLRALDRLLGRHAGPARARALGPAGYDDALHGALAAAGFLDLRDDPAAGPVDALAVVERTAGALGVVAAGAASLVRPSLGSSVDAGAVVAVATDPVGGGPPVARFAARADHLVRLAADGPVRLLDRGEFQHGPAATDAGPVLSTVHVLSDAGLTLAVDERRVAAWWALALVAEILGTAQAAFDLTVAHVQQRHQFGRPLGANQALQHRLAALAVELEGTRLLAYESAWHGADDARIAVVAARAGRLAKDVAREAHQMHGAIGFTREHDLHLYTQRLRSLLAELGPAAQHDADAARARWLPPGR